MSNMRAVVRALVAGILTVAIGSSVSADSVAPPPTLAASTSAQSLGQGQSWYDYTVYRGFGVYYTNTAGRAIQVHVSVGITSRGGGASMYVNGAQVGAASNYSSVDFATAFSAVVPAGSTYMVTGWGSRTGIASWAELR